MLIHKSLQVFFLISCVPLIKLCFWPTPRFEEETIDEVAAKARLYVRHLVYFSHEIGAEISLRADLPHSEVIDNCVLEHEDVVSESEFVDFEEKKGKGLVLFVLRM